MGRISAISLLPIIALAIGRSALTTWLLFSGISKVPACRLTELAAPALAVRLWAATGGAASSANAKTRQAAPHRWWRRSIATAHLILSGRHAPDNRHGRADKSWRHHGVRRKARLKRCIYPQAGAGDGRYDGRP